MKRFVSSLNALVYFFSTTIAALVIALPARAADMTWDGGGADDNISTAANWAGDVAPSDGDVLIFPAATANTTIVNDVLTSVGGITITGGANPDSFGYYFNDDGVADTLSLSGNIYVGAGQTLGMYQDVALTAATVVTLTDAESFFSLNSDNIDLGANTLVFNNPSYASINTDTLSTSLPQASFGTSISVLAAGLAGTSITANGIELNWLDQSTNYIGELILNKSVLRIDETAHIGANTAGIVMTQAQIDPSNTVPMTFDEPLTVNGNLFGRSSAQGFGYEAIANPGSAFTVSGAVLLQSDIVVDPYSGNITFSGDIVGNYLIGVSQVYTVTASAGHLIINATNNESLTSNGDYIVEDGTGGPVTGDSAGQSLIIESGAEVIINGTRGKVIVSPGATLKGTGVLGDVSVLNTATIAPGLSPGCLNLAALSFSTGATYAVEIEGTVACSGFDQIAASGVVTLNDATLTVSFPAAFRPASGDVFTIIDAAGITPISGTFNGLAEGATVTFDAVDFIVSYVGGDGNDVTLTALDSVILAAAPGAPDTGFKFIKGAGIATLIATLMATAALVIFSRKISIKKQ